MLASVPPDSAASSVVKLPASAPRPYSSQVNPNHHQDEVSTDDGGSRQGEGGRNKDRACHWQSDATSTTLRDGDLRDRLIVTLPLSRSHTLSLSSLLPRCRCRAGRGGSDPLRTAVTFCLWPLSELNSLLRVLVRTRAWCSANSRAALPPRAS